MKRFLAGAAVMLAAAGCGSMSKEECAVADWRAIGYEDGAAGAPVSAASSRRAACANKAGVALDMDAYRQGREEGLAVYCRPSNGYAIGSRGGGYSGVCAGKPSEREFTNAYEVGRHLFSLRTAVSSLSGQIRQAQYDLRDVEHRIAQTEVALISPGDTLHGRLELLGELKLLVEEKDDLEATLVALDRDHERASADLAAYRDELAYHGGWRGVVQPVDAHY